MHGTYVKIVVWALNIRIWPTGICVTVVTIKFRLKRFRFSTH